MLSQAKVVSAVVVLVHILLQVSGAMLTIHPETANITSNGSVTVTCEYDPERNITVLSCQFKVRALCERFFTNWHQFSLQDGQSPLEPSVRQIFANNSTAFATYHGEGFARGRCGMDLRVVGSGRFQVACSVQYDQATWVNDHMFLVVNEHAENDTAESKPAADAPDTWPVNVGVASVVGVLAVLLVVLVGAVIWGWGKRASSHATDEPMEELGLTAHAQTDRIEPRDAVEIPEDDRTPPYSLLSSVQ